MTKAEFDRLLEKLGQLPNELTRLVSGLPHSDVCRRARPGDFSLLESVCHLRDIDTEGYCVRISRILKEDKPALPDIDGGRMAIERNYNNQNFAEALEAFTAARLEIVALLRSIRLDELDRGATLDGMGNITLAKLLLLMREHDESHWQEMREMVTALSSGSADAVDAQSCI